MKAHVALVAVEFERRFRHHEVHGGDEVLAQCVLIDEILFALTTARGARADVCVARVFGGVVFVAVAAVEVGGDGGGRAGSGITGGGWSRGRSVGGGGRVRQADDWT